jgi:uncharacterized protein (TIGR03067 family)
MRYRTFAALTIIPCLFIASIATADSYGKDAKIEDKLAGVWEIEDGVNQGEELSEDELEGTTMVVKGDTIITYDKDKKEKYRAMFTIDAAKKPIHIDMVTYMKGRPPMKSLGILKFEEDDEFELCYALPGEDRPTKFKSPEGSKIMLFECERED